MINRKLVETPVRMMNRMEEITDLICEYNEEVQKQQQEIERLNNIIKEVREYTSKTQMPEGYKKMILEILNKVGDEK